jgi:phage replication-related protein YjqB (UPF0714/DUF867 family)
MVLPCASPRMVASLVVAAVASLGSLGCGGAERTGAGSRDTYANFADLAAHQQEGRDFTVTVTDHGAPASVFAFHGGHIDTGTEKIAAAVAGRDWNSYVLVGRSYQDHVTSANFDDPRLLALARRSARCAAIHGHKSETPRICVGGANTAVRAAVARSLSSDGLPFEVLTHCEGLDGEAPTNPANLCAQGVQLEFSGAARDQLFADPALMSSTARAIRAALDALAKP